ncbi:bifunctional ornithine acetyltransferase/N-acetylglutamate synthase, partial [Candidatus Omnitrophota bacterium]
MPGLPVDDVLIASTGVIGQRLPLARIKRKIGVLVQSLSRQASKPAAEAILTADTKIKQKTVEIKIGKAKVRIAAIDKRRLNQALQTAVNNSFNMISVDGEMSTNDMVLVLANGQAANQPISASDFTIFTQALNYVCLSLAKMIVQDAEGATKFVEIHIEQARDLRQAKDVAFKIANSPLVKTAIFGENPNWGRIAACCGALKTTVIKQERLDIYLGGVKVLQRGAALKANRRKLNNAFKHKEIQIRVSLGLGKSQATAFTCDLSNKYVKINAEY